MLFSSLPQDVIHNILSYSDKIKYRNGKYMNQIRKNDVRYNLFLRIPPIAKDIRFEHVYEMIYRPTYTILTVEIVDDTIIYAFCYDCEENPDKYHLWIRQ